jgi:hypothetical protein
MEQRAAYRFLTDTTVHCRVPASPAKGTISDISTHGCRLRIGRGVILPGSTILLELLPGFHAIGHVVWKNERDAGIRFDTPLHNTLIDNVRAGNH